MIDNYIPLLVDGHLLVLDIHSTVHHKHILEAVTRGLPILTRVGAAEERKRMERGQGEEQEHS